MTQQIWVLALQGSISVDHSSRPLHHQTTVKVKVRRDRNFKTVQKGIQTLERKIEGNKYRGVHKM